jgi:acetyl/propionyl-CoA carboxylase alpha subunit
VVGVDLVRAQLLVASGEPIPWQQDALSQRGHAIDARIYAEDPANGFLPQAGPLLLYREPRLPGVRIDSGIAEGDEVPRHYDPLLAKVIASADSRKAAIERLIVALQSFPILGIRTNIPFLIRVLDHPEFRAGRVDTAFLDRELASIVEQEATGIPAHVVAALQAHGAAPGRKMQSSDQSPRGQWDPWDRLHGWRD